MSEPHMCRAGGDPSCPHCAVMSEPQYPLTSETSVVHLPGCRCAVGSLTWPRWGGSKVRACLICLPGGLPERTPKESHA